jgi:hypothetical protein
MPSQTTPGIQKKNLTAGPALKKIDYKKTRHTQQGGFHHARSTPSIVASFVVRQAQ